MVATLAVAVVLGPGLLSADRPTGAAAPTTPSAPAASPDAGAPARGGATGWTGAAHRADGNDFVPAEARRLRLPRFG